jgi:protein phosphatase methylesterase 1
VEDFVAAVLALREQLFPTQQRFYFAGHSLGGAVVVNALHKKDLAPLIGGVVVMDVVESLAKHSLQYMHAILQQRPSSFSSEEEAALWFVHHGGMHSESSAKITVPFLLRQQDDGRYAWKTNLSLTETCWETWFDRLDQLFITLPCPKMLCLANTDRLDKELTIAHMQGKFQLEVIGTQGHYVQEDEPKAVAGKVTRFVHRVETLTRKLPPVKH